MNILSYSPSVEVYAQAIGKGGESRIYDLSEDVVNVVVTRASDAPSTFSLRLQNKGWKYNDVFTPMDKVVIYATKTSRVKLFSGYIGSVDKFTLYQTDFNMSGFCTLYRINNMYWDAGLPESMRLLYKTRTSNPYWGGYSETITDLLTQVGGWDESHIMVGDIPEEAMAWARDMYEAQAEDTSQFVSMVDEFYNVLGSSGIGVSFTGSNSEVLTSDDIKSIDDLPSDSKAEVKKVSSARQKVVARAVSCLGLPYVWGATGPKSYDCSGLVGYCLTGGYERLGTTYTFMEWPTAPNPLPGDIATHSEHCGVYIGAGRMVHASSPGVGVIIGGVQSGMKIVRYSGLA